MINLCPNDAKFAYFNGRYCCDIKNCGEKILERTDYICPGKYVLCPKEGTCEDRKLSLEIQDFSHSSVKFKLGSYEGISYMLKSYIL